MNIGWLTVGMIGVAALGTLLYRTYKLENNLPKLPNPPARPRSTQNKRTTPYEGDMRVSESRSYAQLKNVTPAPVAIDDDAEEAVASGSFAAIPAMLLVGIAALAVVLPGDYRISTTLGLVQGLGEFLPISSSAHLIITPWLFGWNDANAFYNTQWYDVTLHIGTLLALLGFFWRDWLQLIASAAQPSSENGRLFWLIVVASLPGAAIGFVLDQVAEDFFRDKYLVIATSLAVMGVLLYVVDRNAPQRDNLTSITWKKAVLVGLAQSLAFIPGVSRSGSTMTMGRAMGLQRETAARFSFLMAMPITFGAALLKMRDIEAAAMRTAPFWLGIGVSFLVGVLAIGFLLRYLKTNSFLPFTVYRLGLALVIVVIYLLRNNGAS
jgi:undecaprenyl-diphosphatase